MTDDLAQRLGALLTEQALWQPGMVTRGGLRLLVALRDGRWLAAQDGLVSRCRLDPRDRDDSPDLDDDATQGPLLALLRTRWRAGTLPRDVLTEFVLAGAFGWTPSELAEAVLKTYAHSADA